MTDQASLGLPESDSDERSMDAAAGSLAVGIVTNRWNVLEFLTRGLVVPSDGFRKYYSDLGRMSPQRIVILRAPLSPSVVSDVTSEDRETAFPVFLELDSASSQGEGPALTGDGMPLESSQIADPRASAWAPSTVFDLDAFSALHFRSEEEREEHTIRAGDYANAVALNIPNHVTPHLFAGAGVELDQLSGWLGSLPPGEFTRRRLEEADRLGGALLGGVAATPGSKQHVQLAIRLLEDPSASPGKPARDGSPEWLSGWKPGARTSKASDSNTLVFHAACSVLSSIDLTKEWRGTETLEKIVQRVSKRANLESLAPYLDYMRDVLGDRATYDPARQVTDGEVLRSLLMVLLRPDLERLLKWFPESGGTASERMTAGFLSGLIAGRTMLPSSVRSPELDGLVRRRERIALGVESGDRASLYIWRKLNRT